MELTTWNIPVLALRGLTVFPHMDLTFDVERPISIAALSRAMETDQAIFLVTQKEMGTAVPEEKDLYRVGTVSHITQVLRVSEGSVRVMVEGGRRARMKRLWQSEPFLQANVEALPEQKESEAFLRSARTEALLRQTAVLFDEYAGRVSGLPDEIKTQVQECRDPGYLADFLAQNIRLRTEERQSILEEPSPYIRLRKLNEFLARENDVLAFEGEMEDKVRSQLARSQREQILRTQIRVMQGELGETDDGDEELDDYRARILRLGLPEETESHLLKEVDKLSKQPYTSAESAVIRGYLDVCLEMPWNTQTRERLNVEAARKILDKDHFGLEKVKRRILETIAVRQMNPEGRGQILCLVGPPGVGKTSIAISVAKALNRKLARLSLGGVRDEADIRGHRKTYIGSMPGRIIEAISRSKSMNPLLLLDEIDKLGSDYRGDPAAALLEVLDSEQNCAFRDHFMEIPVLERRVAALCRKADMQILTGGVKRLTVEEKDLPELLDMSPYPPALHAEREETGVVNGLAWTEVGGEILEVEVNVMPGTGKLELTGNLGDVMKESAQAALSCLRSRTDRYEIDPEFYKNTDIHIHFPEGAVPKDGPSAGIAIATALCSALTGRKVRAGLAMTGEITLRGRVLAIGGLKEKTMAALRNGIGTVLIPQDNVRDLEQIDQTVRAALEFVPVTNVDEVLSRALCPAEKKKKKAAAEPAKPETAEPLAAFAPARSEGGQDALRQ